MAVDRADHVWRYDRGGIELLHNRWTEYHVARHKPNPVEDIDLQRFCLAVKEHTTSPGSSTLRRRIRGRTGFRFRAGDDANATQPNIDEFHNRIG